MRVDSAMTKLLLTVGMCLVFPLLLSDCNRASIPVLTPEVGVYFPLREGKSYKFEIDSRNAKGYAQTSVEWTILGPRQLNGVTVFPRRVTLNNGLSYVMFFSQEKDSIKTVAVQGLYDPEPKLIPAPVFPIKSPIKVGTNWDSFMFLPDNSSVPMKYTIEDVDEVVTVPAGTFKGCIRVSSVGSNEKRTLQDVNWYAPGVGLIKFIRKDEQHAPTTQTAEVVTQLQSYK